MGFLQDLDLDGLVSGFREMAQELNNLKDDIVSSVVEPGSELHDTIQDISRDITGAGDTTPPAEK